MELDFSGGFGVLTGETGAGKSLLVESLKLLGGQRAQTDLVRTGDDRLVVEGVFADQPGAALAGLLDELGIAADDVLVLRREVSAAGRSRCWINDVTVTAAALQRAAPHLLAIHGQHEQYGLADGDVQRQFVDDFGGHDELQERTASAFTIWRAAADELDRLHRAQSTRRDRLDAIAFQVQEIAAANPGEGEDDELRRRRLVLRHSVRIAELCGSLLERLSDAETSVLDELARGSREIDEVIECGLPLEDSATRLTEARLQVEEVVREVQGLSDDADRDPDELEGVESRLHLLEKLMLKYGSSLAEVLVHRDALDAERAELLAVEERVEEAAAAAGRALDAYDRAARALDEARREAGAEFAKAVSKVLGQLAMGGTRLEFRWQPRVDAASPLLRDGNGAVFGPDGVEECVLLIAANPGEEPRPMARIASGGELSRVHLAMRTVLRKRRAETGLTLLFDEVDSGLGGATAAALAELLAQLAAVDQVLVVTHLPQVAARADGHFRVEKVVDRGRATTRVVALEAGERETEVARMLAGDEVTDSAREHARVLLGKR